MAKPFGYQGMSPERQLELFDDFSWFDPVPLPVWRERAMTILSSNPMLPGQRLKAIDKELKRRSQTLETIALRKIKKGKVYNDKPRRTLEGNYRTALKKLPGKKDLQNEAEIHRLHNRR